VSQYYGYICKSCNAKEVSLINRGREELIELANCFDAIRIVQSMRHVEMPVTPPYKEAYDFLCEHHAHALYLTDEQESFEVALTDREQWDEEYFCDNCKCDTVHTCYIAGHERDSSNDYKRCTKCDNRSEL
jgi:hypothetical protein